MNKSLREFKEINGMEIAKRRIYEKTYFALTGKKISVDDESLGVPYSPKEEKGREIIDVVQGILWGNYSSKEFYRLSSKPGFIEKFSNLAVDEYKRRYERKKDNVETTLEYRLAFGSDGLTPVVTQDSRTKEVLILAFANEEAVEKTLETGIATYWSRSRKELWIKGLTSGDFLKVDEVRINCEQNSLVYLVTPQGKGACHTKDENGVARQSCYYRKIVATSKGKYLEKI